MSYTSLIRPLVERAKQEPDRVSIIFISNDGSEEKITAGRLHAESLAYSRALKKLGVRPQDVVILALGHCKELIYAFWGTLYSGAIPSIFPYPLPRPGPEVFNRQIRSCIINSGARAVVAESTFETQLVAMLYDSDCKMLNARSVSAGGENRSVSPLETNAGGEDIAYLQYTSGTTGMRKGVLLSHRAVLNFVSSFRATLEEVADDVIVNWLPLYHDYGLFSGLVFPLIVGVNLVLMSPFKWVRSPKALLWAIDRHKGTLCWMPNSAYNHMVRSIRQSDLEGLDLSGMRAFGAGGEMIRYASQMDFFERFAPFGLKARALATGYGMAENTLCATVSSLDTGIFVEWVDAKNFWKNRRAIPTGRNEEGAVPFVSCGFPVEGATIAISEDGESFLPERRVGEILIRTKTLFNGYKGRADLTAQAMRDGWYYTGDIGYLAEGQLFVCGRNDDLIIVGGKKIHPEDLETIANTIPGIYPDRAVAFGIADPIVGSERIVMVCELEKNVMGKEKLNIERELRKRIVRELSIPLGELRLVNKKWVVKTRNGKMARNANREKYLVHFKR